MDQQEQSLEQMLADIEEMIEQIQQRDISLEDSFALYQQGVEKLKRCNGIIDKVEKKLLMLNQDGSLEQA